MKPFFIEIQNFWAWADTFWGIWGIFCQTISTHFGRVSPLSMISIIQPLFLQKTTPLYPTPKYLFGSGIWIWAAKNLRFSLRVSVVRDAAKAVAAEPRAKHCQWDKRISKQKKREKNKNKKAFSLKGCNINLIDSSVEVRLQFKTLLPCIWPLKKKVIYYIEVIGNAF